MDLYPDTVSGNAIVTPWATRSVPYIDLRIGYQTPFNLYFLTPDILHPRAPYDITRYPGAAISMQLKQDGVAAIATQGTWAEIVPNFVAGATRDATVTITIASPGVATDTSHGYSNGQAIVLSTTGALPTGLVAGTTYFVINEATNTYQLSPVYNGPAINTSGTQSGVHTSAALSAITRVTSGTATKGEYDRIQLAATPGSGSYVIQLKGGVITAKGAVSASARIYPTVSSAGEIEGALSSIIGAPYLAEFVSPSILDIHGSATPGTAPSVQEVTLSDLQFLFGWSGNLDLSSVNANQAGLDSMYLQVLLTPNGGVQQSVLKLPVNLVAS
jgi:hypothetical protein